MSGATYNSSWIYNPEANNYQVTFFIDAEGALLAVGEGRIDEETLNQGLDIITGKAEADLEK